jgi:phosphatidylinositol alpha-mannosyltransferase
VRVLLVSSYDVSRPGGVTSHVFDVAKHFRLLGHEVEVAGPGGSGPLKRDGHTHCLGETFRFWSPGDAADINLNPLVVNRVRDFLRRRRFDVVHLHEPFIPFIGPAFLRLAEGWKVGTFHTWRRGPHIPYIVFWGFCNYWNRRLDGRIAVSKPARDTINRYVRGDYQIIPNGVDFERFAAPAPAPAHLADDRPTVLFVARLEARKGVAYLIRAFAEVKRRLPETRLVIVGRGGLEGEYRKLAAGLGLADVLFEGFVEPPDLPGYYQRADVLCAPSTVNESFGISIAEAMAAGTPVIGTTIEGLKALVEPEVTGLAVPPKDVPALADALERLLSDAGLRERLGAGARERARRYAWENVARQLLDYYAGLGVGAPA